MKNLIRSLLVINIIAATSHSLAMNKLTPKIFAQQKWEKRQAHQQTKSLQYKLMHHILNPETTIAAQGPIINYRNPMYAFIVANDDNESSE